MTTPSPGRDPRRSPLTAGAAFAAVGLYLGSMLIGGAWVPAYSHIADSVSELTSSSGPHRWGIAWGFVAYNAAFASMAASLWRAVRRSTASSVGMALWLVIATAGVAMVSAFPQDPMGTDLTATGTIHMILAGIAALGLIVSAFVWARAFRIDDRWADLARGTFWFGWAILIVGGAGAALGGVVPDVFGLGERFTMISYLGWFAWIGAGALRRQPIDARGPRGRGPRAHPTTDL